MSSTASPTDIDPWLAQKTRPRGPYGHRLLPPSEPERTYTGVVSVSLYFHANRATPLTQTETNEVERIGVASRASLSETNAEALHVYNDCPDPGHVLAGATKLPTEQEQITAVITSLLASVTALRRLLPTASWYVHLDDLDIPWHEERGYSLTNIPVEPPPPGMP